MLRLPIAIFFGLASSMVAAEGPNQPAKKASSLSAPAASLAPAQPEKKKSSSDALGTAKDRAAQTEFLRGPLTSIDLELPPAAIQHLRDEPREYVEASLSAGGKVWRTVAVKLKGAQGSFRPIDEKPCFTLNFAKGEGAERFHGYRKAHLNNSREDPSFLRQQLCGEIVRAAGIPALRCTHAWVKLNGRDLGLYVFTEAYTPDLLAPFFSNPSGDLYEGGFCKDIDQGLTKDHGDAEDFAAIQRLIAACAEDEPSLRWKKLREILDTERYATFLSLESMMGIGDGYDFFRNNYRLYHDPKTRLLSFIPHGMDEPFHDADFPIQRTPESIVGRAFIAAPEGRALYRKRVSELYEKIFKARDWPAEVEAQRVRVLAFAGKHDAGFARGLRGPQQELEELVAARISQIGKALGDLASPLVFDKAGLAKLPKGWTTKQEGEADLERADKNLHITARGECQASWRYPVVLEPGHYRFQATVETHGITGDGAGIRISGQEPTGSWLAGTHPREKLSYEFDAPDSGEVVLVAELRAKAGEVTFAADTLQLVRLK